VTGLSIMMSTPGGFSLASRTSATPVSMTITGLRGARRLIIAASSAPLISGMAWSVTTDVEPPDLKLLEGLESVRRGRHCVAVAAQKALDNLQRDGVVLDEQDAERPDLHACEQPFTDRLAEDPQWQPDSNRRSPSRRAVDFDRPAMPLDDAVHARQAEAGSAVALRREERLEAPSLHLRRHAGPRIGHLGHGGRRRRVRQRPHRERASLGHGVHGVEDHVGEHVAKLRGVAVHDPGVLQLGHQPDRPPRRLRLHPPLRLGE